GDREVRRKEGVSGSSRRRQGILARRRAYAGFAGRAAPRQQIVRESFAGRIRTPNVPLYSSDAIILRTYKLGEADRIVVFLTRDRGKKRGGAKGARRARSRFVGALEPLTQVRVAYFEKERRELVNLNYSEPARSALSGGTVESLGCAAYFAELIDEWAAESHEDERLYRLGASMVDALVGGVPPEPL